MNCWKSRLFVVGCGVVGFCPHAWAATNLPFGQVVTGTISSVAQSNTYTLSANANDIVNFTVVVTSGKLQPEIVLFNPNGTQLAYNYYGSTVELNQVKLPTTGNYTVLVKDVGDTNTGGYLIYAQRTNNPAGAVPLLFGGQPQSGTIGSAAQSNSYILTANANDIVNFTMVVTSGNLQPEIVLFNPNGTQLAYNYYGSTVELNQVKLPTTGNYIVLVKDVGDTKTGGYLIYAQRTNNPAGVVPLVFGGQPQTGMIASEALSNSYVFGSSAGDIVSFTVVVTSGNLQPEIVLFNPDGTQLAYNYYGSTVELNQVKLPTTGNYIVLIKDVGDTNTGNYSLSAQCFGVCTGPPPPPAVCNYALAPVTQVIPAAAGIGNVGVLTTAGCPWTASSSGPFLTITSGSSGDGSGTVEFSATANSSQAARSGTLTIGGQTATINQSGTAPILLLTPSSIAVQWTQQSPLPPVIPLSIYTGASSANYTAVASSTGNWLSVSPPAGSAPATVNVTVNPSSLQPGNYQGTVNINAPTANPSSQNFTVSLTVVAAGSPSLSVATKSLSYTFAQGAQQIQQRILIGNSGGGTLNYQAAASTNSGGNWLSVTQDEAGATLSTPDLLTVAVDPSGLSPGTYTGAITITANAMVTIPVTVVVNAVEQTILLSQTGLTFTAVANGGIVPPQTFGILNSGTGVMDWSVSSTTVTGGSWLSVTPNSGNTDASSLNVPLVTVSVNAAGVAPGQYSGQIQVTSMTANNAPQFVSVILNVLPAGSNPGPLVLPTGLIFTQAAGGTPAASQTITLSNLTASQETFTTGTLTDDGANWFTVAPTTGTASPTQATTLTVSVSSTGLTPAIRQGVLTILFQDGSVRTVNVLFLLANGGVSSSERASRPLTTAASCTPTKLLPLLTSLGSQFTVPAAWPNTLQAQVVDDCGNPQVTGTVVASFSNGDPPLPLISLKNGDWTGTWQVGNASASIIAVTVNADDPVLGISGSVSVSGSLQSSVNAPVMLPGGVVNTASYAPSTPLSPGTMIAIFGYNLANGTSNAQAFPLPSQLSGTLVTIGGVPAPLLYAGSGQVNAVIPYGLPENINTQVIVQQGNEYTVPYSIVMGAADPGIFTATASGSGQGVIVAPNGNFAQPGNPAHAGDEITIYAAGLGNTNPGAMTGLAATVMPLLQVVAPVSLTIGGQNARVDFAGLAPGFTGLYQINAAVPSGVSGSAVPVVLTVGGQPSPPVTMAVQ
jgi:uncharacterized protein (TIGR03437 family)